MTTASGARQFVNCTFDGLNGKRLEVTCEQRVQPGEAIQVEYNDAMFLGEVLASSHNVDDSWHLEIKVEQILTGLQSLVNLRSRLLGEPVRELSPLFAGRR